jgi:hypothetical protein
MKKPWTKKTWRTMRKNDNYMKKIILHHQTNLGYPATTK